MSVSENSNYKIVPVFGGHEIHDQARKRASQFESEMVGTEAYPGFCTWPDQTVQTVAQLRPSFLAVDGDSYDHLFDKFSLSRSWEYPGTMFGMPGDPFALRGEKDLFIVDADLGYFGLLQYKGHKRVKDANPELEPRSYYSETLKDLDPVSRQARDLMSDSVVDYIEKYDHVPLEYDNIVVFDDKELAIGEVTVKQYLFEYFISLGLGIVAAHNLLYRMGRQPMTRRQFLLGSVGAMGLLNAVRFKALMTYGLMNRSVPVDRDIPTQWWAKPISALVTGTDLKAPVFGLSDAIVLDLRNALVAMKTREAQERVPQEEQSAGPGVIVFGTAHKYGKDLWNDSQAQTEVISQAVGEMFSNLKDAQLDLSNPTLKQSFVDQLSQYLGGTALWRVKQSPERYTPKEIASQISLVESYTSPRVRAIVEEVSSKFDH